MTQPLHPVLRRIITRLPEEQQCSVRHWINRRAYAVLRKETRYVGHGANAVTYSLRPFDERRCIFVHIPKAAGVSVSLALFGNLAGGHRSARDYRRIFGRDFWNYFKFTFVRNPYTRLVSAYEFLRTGGHAAWASNQVFRDEFLSQYSDFPNFVLRGLTPGRHWTVPHFRPQHELLELDGKLVMDFVGHIERIAEDFGYVCDRLGIQARLRRVNDAREARATLSTYYADDAVKRRVQDLYAKDFELFGYSAQPPAEP